MTLSGLLEVGLLAPVGVEAWQGPLGGVQDFALGTGAIEVKSTVSPSGFLAIIGSLEQLDNSLIRPLFLAGVRFALNGSGDTLPDLIAYLRDLLRGELAALATFDARLLHAGFIDVVSEHYTRRFVHVRTRLHLVTDTFPRLIQTNVRIEIRKARYEIDLDLVNQEEVGLDSALRQMGVI